MSHPPDDERAEVPSTVGSYRVERRLGAGGMGAVYRGFDEVLERPVALKRILAGHGDRTRARRFRREARMAARLNHPAIVHVYEVVETEDCDWLVMELVDGKTLDRLLREGQVDSRRAVRIAREVSEGLAEAHAQGIVHRDLKASNVMVTAAGRVKILDFGLAKDYRGEAGRDISADGAVVGTYHAMSPEQAQGLAVDHRSDLFSLGSLLYEMLTGVSPFEGTGPMETIARVCSHDPRPVLALRPDLPHELSALVHGLMRKSPADRPQQASAVAAALRRIEDAALAATDDRGTAELPATSGSGDDAARPATPARSAPLTSSERRQLTVVCCELVAVAEGSSAPRPLEPEALYELMPQLRPLAQKVVERHEGTLAGAQGQGLLVYFGYPEAHEDDAVRAVRAALDLLAEAGDQLRAAGLGRARPALRAGVHTGPAVIAAGSAGGEPVVLGATHDVALRVQAAAPASAVAISPTTRSLVRRAFLTEPLEPLPPLAGQPEPLVPHRVRQELDSGEDGGLPLAPLVGRERELLLLLERWREARGGSGQAVLLAGEPGIGKSRLLRALRERLSEGSTDGAAGWLSLQASPYTQNTPLHPVVGLLRRWLAAEPAGPPAERLAAFLRRHSLEEALPLFASLLELPLDAGGAPLAMPPERQREQTLEALVELVLRLSEGAPLVLQVEDLHWLDASTLAWLERLIEPASAAPLLILMTVRTHAVEVPWASRARVAQVNLAPLGGAESARLVEALASGRPLGDDLRRQIVEKTDGVPLFLEELTRSVLEGGGPEDRQELPATLRDSLAARLARLGAAKEVAQLASVLGRTFPFRRLAAVASRDEDALERELRRLVQAGLVHRRGFGASARYSFKHALVRDAAYDSLLRRERQQLHLRVAAEMEEERRAGEEVPSEEIARHCTAGEQHERAYELWLEAGQRAMARSAHAEAIGHLQHGLAALEALPGSRERDLREIALRSALAMSLGVIRGLAAPEVEAVYERILALTGQIDHVPQQFYFGLWNFYMTRGRLVKAREMAARRLARGEASGDARSLYMGLYTSASADEYLGDLHAARAGFERLLSVYPREGLGDEAVAYDIGVVARALLGDVLWHLGCPEAATRQADEAIELARGFSPFTSAVALVIRLILASSMRDLASVRRRAEQLVALSAEHGYQFWSVFWQISLALARAAEAATPAEADAALREAHGAITTMRTAYGSSLQCSRYLAWTADACLRHGRADLARPALDEALALAAEERYWEADLRRLEAGVRLAEGAPAEEAELLLERALASARGQQARIFELRAAGDLAALRAGQGRRDEAAALLGAVYDSFGEGLETPDLAEARERLTRLRPPRG